MSLLLRALRPSAFLLLMAGFVNINAQTHTPRYTSITANSKAFYEYLPQGYNTNESYPLIVFLHGVGELGNGSPDALATVLKNGLPRVINEGKFPTSFNTSKGSFKFIVISPEFVNWPNANDIQGVIDYAVRNYRVDQSRIYLTGLSMGGGVCWDYPGASLQNANRLAALVPVCGSSDPDPVKSLFIATGNLPVWALHNDGDPQVPVWNTNRFVDLINALVPTPIAKKTIFHSSDHDAWTVSFNPNFRENGMNIYEWMLQNQRGNSTSSPANSNRAPVANAGSDVTITLPTSSATITANGSDPDGSVSSYTWIQLSGPTNPTIINSITPTPTITGFSEGEYTFRFTVTDNAGASTYDDVIVKVLKNVSADNSSRFNVPGRIEAENYADMSGIQNEATGDDGGGLNVGYINARDWMDYKLSVSSSGNYNVTFRTATTLSNQSFQVINGNGNVLATIDVPKTSSFQKYTNSTVSIYLSAGDQTLRLYSLSDFWNINWMSFDLSTAGRPSSFNSSSSSNFYQHIEAEDYSNMSGIEKETCFDANGGLNVDWINGGDWMDYTVTAPSAGSYTLNFRLATSKNNQQFQLKNSGGDVLTTVNVPNTGDFQIWSTVSATVTLPAGTQTLRIYSLSQYWNINWLEINNSTSSERANSARVATQAASTLSDILGVSDQISASVYPNPVREKFILSVTNALRGSMQVQIVDQSGTIRKTFNYSKNQNSMQLSLPASDLPAGTYYIRTQVGKWRGISKLIKL